MKHRINDMELKVFYEGAKFMGMKDGENMGGECI